jgi:hypothetical protein
MFGNAVCPPLVAAIAGETLALCRPDDVQEDWIAHGRSVEIQLAVSAVLPIRNDTTWMRLRLNHLHLFPL